jgi:two-component system response regulator MprA
MAAPSNPGERQHGAVILVVERDPHIRELESYFLEQAGYAVEFAQDGLQALDLVLNLTPDIVITEILVPKLDGLALCRRIKSTRGVADTSVLIFSILAAATRAREAGADAFLMKPLAEQLLVDTVKELLAQREGVAS